MYGSRCNASKTFKCLVRRGIIWIVCAVAIGNLLALGIAVAFVYLESPSWRMAEDEPNLMMRKRVGIYREIRRLDNGRHRERLKVGWPWTVVTWEREYAPSLPPAGYVNIRPHESSHVSLFDDLANYRFCSLGVAANGISAFGLAVLMIRVWNARLKCRHQRFGHCSVCGYFTGPVLTKMCPECGTEPDSDAAR